MIYLTLETQSYSGYTDSTRSRGEAQKLPVGSYYKYTVGTQVFSVHTTLLCARQYVTSRYHALSTRTDVYIFTLYLAVHTTYLSVHRS